MGHPTDPSSHQAGHCFGDSELRLQDWSPLSSTSFPFSAAQVSLTPFRTCRLHACCRTPGLRRTGPNHWEEICAVSTEDAASTPTNVNSFEMEPRGRDQKKVNRTPPPMYELLVPSQSGSSSGSLRSLFLPPILKTLHCLLNVFLTKLHPLPKQNVPRQISQ